VESGEGIESRSDRDHNPRISFSLWNPVKELKDCCRINFVLRQLEWNPVKELKVAARSSATVSLSVWNPVKELKGEHLGGAADC